MTKVYISASNQHKNIGVGDYGTEKQRMHELADRVKYYIEQGSNLSVERNHRSFTLKETCLHANASGAVLFIDNHSNAGPAAVRGMEVYYRGNSTESKTLAHVLYDSLSPITPTEDRGVKADTTLYSSGLYVLRNTKMPACLIEHIFHTNAFDVAGATVFEGPHDSLFHPTFFLLNIDKFAKAEAKAVCDYLGVTWKDPDLVDSKPHPAENAFAYLNKNGIPVYDKRFDDNIKRGDALEMFARMFQRLTNIPRD